MYCPAGQLESISIPPVSKLAEKSASYADTLLNADVTEMICYHACTVPFICKYCPGQESKTLPYLPFDNLTENTASLAETLASADVSAPMHCVQAKTALIELRARIIYSDIDERVRHEISEQILELEKLTETCANQLTSMLSSFDAALDTIQIYTQFLLEDLSESENSNKYQGRQLQIGMINISFSHINTHIPIAKCLFL
jgi:hypothetical protein